MMNSGRIRLNLVIWALSGCMFLGAALSAQTQKNSTPATPKTAVKQVPTFSLYQDGQPVATLYLPKEMNRISFLAVEELQNHLEAMTGARLPVSYLSDDHFAYGRPRYTQVVLQIRPEKEWKGKESPQGFQVIGDNKRPNRNTLLIRGNSSIGLLYGVYDFLESQGVRFYTPDPEDGTIISRKETVNVPIGVRSVTPVFTRREMNLAGVADTHFDPSRDPKTKIKDYTRWHLRNRLFMCRNIDSGEFGFNRMPSGGSHGLSGARGNANFAKEPERFRMVNGKRVKNGQICWTNAKNIETAVNNALEFYQKVDKNQKDSDLYDVSLIQDISLFDWGGALCECPECMKIGGQEPNRLDRQAWSFINAVAKEVARKRPDAALSLFAPYLELTKPPEDVKIEPNVFGMACRSEAWVNRPENENSYPFTKFYEENVKATLNAGAKLAVYEYILWQGTPQPLDVLDAIAKYRALGNGTSFYTAEVMQRNDLWFPVWWAMARALFYEEKQPREYLADFCREYFGEKFGKAAMDFYTDMSLSAKKMERRIYGGLESTSAIMTDSLIRQYRQKLESAKSGMVTGPQLRRAERFRNAFESAAKTAELYRAHCDALNNRDDASLAKVKKLYHEFQKFYPKIAEYCSPDAMSLLDPIGKMDYKAIKPGRVKELDDDAKYKAALFSRATAPEKINHLFKLPEYWLFRVDPTPNTSGEFIKPEYDASKGWQKISTWDCYESQDYYECGAQFWYRLTFDGPEFPSGKQIFLRIGALDDSGEVYLNGVKVGQSDDSSDWDKSFEMNITKQYKPGQKNTIVIRGYDAFGAGGLWRPSAIYTE